jgi:exonuclease SbcC
MRVEGQLSGGERSATAICIRLAFALVLTQSLGWIILDEPTHNLDERGVKELAGLLKEHLPQLVDQIFIITHDPVLEHAATGTLHRIERDKENDGVSKPVAMQVFRSD